MDFLVRGHIKREAGSCCKRSLVSYFWAHLCWIHFSASPYAVLSCRKTKFCRPALFPLCSCVSLFKSGFDRSWRSLEYRRKGEIWYFLPFLQGFPGALATLPWLQLLPGDPGPWTPSAWAPFFVSPTRSCWFVGCPLWGVGSIYFSCYKYTESLLFACLDPDRYINTLVCLACFSLSVSFFSTVSPLPSPPVMSGMLYVHNVTYTYILHHLIREYVKDININLVPCKIRLYFLWLCCHLTGKNRNVWYSLNLCLDFFKYITEKMQRLSDHRK